VAGAGSTTSPASRVALALFQAAGRKSDESLSMKPA
jgi:hypothetical protein